ncbi:hypothetical protein SH668x_002123 [Planctomicrobium sp. SH668]|uniref:hypothetical protein n=1 Tax=Planctomicrobium sp. SH668 TaxID=3448126 RepID=UPI003F5BDBA3
MQITHSLSYGVLLLAMTGCQCFGVTERFQDSIDHVADRRPHLDRFYRPTWDLTRIGYPDWTASRINSRLIEEPHNRATRRQPGYIHNPMYVPRDRSNFARPVPAEPQIAPRPDTGADPNDTLVVPTQIKPIEDPTQLNEGAKLPPLPSDPAAPTDPVPPELDIE